MKMSNNQSSGRHAPKNIFGNGFPVKLFLVYLIISPYLYAIANAQTFYEEKKNDQNRPFYMGSRYGRSAPPRSTVHVTPRTDKFFMGSRYGKRAAGLDPGEILTSYASMGNYQNGDALRDSELDLDLAEDNTFSNLAHQRLLKCSYFGIGHLYRCTRDMNQMRSSL